MRCSIRRIIRAIDWSAPCGSRRFRRDGARRLRRYCEPTAETAGLAPEAAAHPAAPGFRPLAVTAIDQESADVLSLTMQSQDGQPLPTALPGQYVVLRLQPDRRRPAAVSQLLAFGAALDGALSNQREDRAERRGWNLSAGACAGGRFVSTSARRAEVSFCSPESGRWCCSARESGRRRFWRCCTRWRRRARHGRSCGCTRLATGSIIHSPPKSAASCSRSRTAAAMSVTAGRTRATRWARISTPPVTCRDRSSTRSAFHERRMSTSAGRLASWQT